LPSPATTATTPVVALGGRRIRDGCEQPVITLGVCSCMFAISTRSIVPAAMPIESAAPGSSV
jgi:hypothetical protein